MSCGLVSAEAGRLWPSPLSPHSALAPLARGGSPSAGSLGVSGQARPCERARGPAGAPAGRGSNAASTEDQDLPFWPAALIRAGCWKWSAWPGRQPQPPQVRSCPGVLRGSWSVPRFSGLCSWDAALLVEETRNKTMHSLKPRDSCGPGAR